MKTRAIRTCAACDTLLPAGARYCCQCGVPVAADASSAAEQGRSTAERGAATSRLEDLLLDELVRADYPEVSPAAVFGSLREWMHTRLDLDAAYPVEAITIAALDAAIDFARVSERLAARDTGAAARLGLQPAPRLRLLPPLSTAWDDDEGPSRYRR